MFGHFSFPPPWFQQNNSFRKGWWIFCWVVGFVVVFFFPLLRQLFEGLSAKELSRDRGSRHRRVRGIIAARHEIWFAKYLKKVGAGFVFSLSLVNGN